MSESAIAYLFGFVWGLGSGIALTLVASMLANLKDEKESEE